MSQIHYNRKEYRTEYLVSPEWRKTRNRILDRNPICVLCNKNKSDDVHHLNYNNLYQEKEEDVIGICRKCHNRIHRHPGLSNQKNFLKLVKLFNDKFLLELEDRKKSKRLNQFLPSQSFFHPFSRTKKKNLEYSIRKEVRNKYKNLSRIKSSGNYKELPKRFVSKSMEVSLSVKDKIVFAPSMRDVPKPDWVE